MRIPRSYTDQELAPGQEVELEAGPSQHLARALRMAVGDELELFNGDGKAYSAVLSAVGKRLVSAHIEAALAADRESPLHIHLGIAVSRGDRMDWVVQKATELGAAVVTPLHSQRTGVKLPGERAAKKLRHWQQIAISACEQCGRNRLPVIAPVTPLEQWLARTDSQRRFVLHHRAINSAGAVAEPTNVALLVGPEGGLAQVEIDAAEQAGFEALQLGPRVLRTETAPLAAIALLQSRWGDMQGLR